MFRHWKGECAAEPEGHEVRRRKRSNLLESLRQNNRSTRDFPPASPTTNNVVSND